RRDGGESGGDRGGATVGLAGQPYADPPPAKIAPRRSEQHVDRRPVPILTGTAHHPNVLALQREVVVARGDVDVALLDSFAVNGGRSGHGAKIGDYLSPLTPT